MHIDPTHIRCALREMIGSGEIKPIVDEVYPLSAAATAHERVEHEQRLGAIVLQLDEDVQAPSKWRWRVT